MRIGLLLAVVLLPSIVLGADPNTKVIESPPSYTRRVAEFQAILAKQPTRDAKVRKAVAMVADSKSRYRLDAIDFLASVRAKEAVPTLIQVAKARNEREFALHALGEIRDARSVWPLIHYLSDPDENVRGNAYRSIERITKKSFPYRYDDSPVNRAKASQEIGLWWKAHEKTFKVQESTKEESEEAARAWQKYGQQYLLKH